MLIKFLLIVFALPLSMVAQIIAPNGAPAHRPIPGGVGLNGLASSKLPWVKTWAASGQTLTLTDINSMLIHSVDEIVLKPFPATSTTYALQPTQHGDGAFITACIMTPASAYAGSLQKLDLKVVQGSPATATITYSWTAAQITQLEQNAKLATPFHYVYKVQLACQRK
jgi:hypothetical protein